MTLRSRGVTGSPKRRYAAPGPPRAAGPVYLLTEMKKARSDDRAFYIWLRGQDLTPQRAAATSLCDATDCALWAHEHARLRIQKPNSKRPGPKTEPFAIWLRGVPPAPPNAATRRPGPLARRGPSISSQK